MIGEERIPETSALLDEETRKTLSGVFAKLTDDMVIKAVVDLQQEKSMEMAAFLKALSALSPHIAVEFYDPQEGAVLEMDTRHLPVAGFYRDGVYRRVAFHGVPGGKEINSFVIGIYNLAGPGQEIPKGTLKKIEKLNRPVQVKICVSLSCHHCPGVVIACQHIAMKSTCVSAEMYDANLYPDLVEQYDIQRVPLLVLNDREIFAGPRSMEDLVQLFKDVW